MRIPRDFMAVANAIIENSPDVRHCAPVVEKELLHLEILSAMHSAGHLRNLVFKGGTCLRLCYGSQRFSEDLDFSGGEAFQPDLLRNIEDVLRDGIGARYGLAVTVSSPKPMRSVSRWVARVTTRPPRRPRSTSSIGIQRIKIEVDNTPHPRGTNARPLLHHYRRHIGSYMAPPIRCASLRDVMADKLVAFPHSVLSRRNPRFRDVWDILWLAPQVSHHETILCEAIVKARRDGLDAAEYAHARALTVDRMAAIVHSDAFSNTLRRFLSKSEFDATIGDPDYREYMVSTMNALLGPSLPTERPQTPDLDRLD